MPVPQSSQWLPMSVVPGTSVSGAVGERVGRGTSWRRCRGRRECRRSCGCRRERGGSRGRKRCCRRRRKCRRCCGRGGRGRRWSRTRAGSADECESAVIDAGWQLVGHRSNKRPGAVCDVDRIEVRSDVRQEQLRQTRRISHRECLTGSRAQRRDHQSIDINALEVSRCVSG